MSRIGKQPVLIPAEVDVQVHARLLSVKGPKGTLTLELLGIFEAVVKDGKICLNLIDSSEGNNALHGLYRSLIANMVVGVTAGYVKQLEIQGVGFKAIVQGKKLMLNLGYSKPIETPIPEGVDVKVAENVNMTISSADKQKLGDFAAHIKALFPAEPYKGKGIRFKGEYVRRKVGKTVA